MPREDGATLADILGKDRANGKQEYHPAEPIPRHTSQDVQHPPHADEMEQHVMGELSALLTKQTALAAQRMGEMSRTQKSLVQHMEGTAKVADVALRLFTETLVEVRLHNEEGDRLLKRLIEGHQQLGLLSRQQKQ